MSEPKVYKFESTGDAYDELQVNDAIKDGDVFVVADEGVVGIAMQAWPVAVTAERGHFHVLKPGSDWASVKASGEARDYRAAFEVARIEAEKLGLPVFQTGEAADAYKTNRELVIAYLHSGGAQAKALSDEDQWTLYCLADGFGPRSPEELEAINGGYDWSHVRDSTPDAWQAMAEWLRERGYGLDGQGNKPQP